MLKIHENILPSGEARAVSLTLVEGELLLVAEDTRVLPDGALDAVMRRYGQPLDPSEQLIRGETLDLGEGCALQHVRHREVWDVIARDYLVYARPNEEPLCALATTVAGALEYLAR